MQDKLIGQNLNQYRIERRLGQGGMGAVYEGVDVDTGRRVAVKVMIRTLGEDPELTHRFEREARVAAEIHNDHVARVFDSGVAGDVRYLVMEYIDGKPIMELIREKGRMSGSRPLELIRQAAQGLDAALEHGIIHRDIKPDNLMLTQDGVVKVVDFGLAKSEKPDSLKTATGAVMGTPHYLSPEQATGNRVDHRSDIYSLGASLYQMLTGHTPFDGDTAIAIIQKHISSEPKAITQYNANVPEPVCQLVYRMLRKHPDERYQTYGHLIRVLDDLIAGRGAPSMTMEVVDEVQYRSMIEADKGDKRKLIMIGVALLALAVVAIGAHHIFFGGEDESAKDGAADSAQGGGIAKRVDDYQTKTVPMLHDIKKFMKENDAEPEKFESRRNRMNKGGGDDAP